MTTSAQPVSGSAVFHDALRELDARLSLLQLQRSELDEREKVTREAIAAVRTVLGLDNESSPAIASAGLSIGRSSEQTALAPATEAPAREARSRTGHSDETKRAALRMLSEGKSQADTAKALGVSAYAVHDWNARSKWDAHYIALLPKSETSENTGGGATLNLPNCVDCGGPRSKYSAERCKKCYHDRAEARRAAKGQPVPAGAPEPDPATVPPLRSKNLVAKREQQGREASQRIKDYRTKVRSGEKIHDACGRCVTRYVEGAPFFAAQPDCPVHGLGLGVAQPGRERKPEPAN